MRIGWVLLALSACGGPMARSLSDAADAGVIAAGDAGVDAGVPQRGPSLAGCPVFPLENAWNRDVSSEPPDPHSADYLAFMGAGSLNLIPTSAAHTASPSSSCRRIKRGSRCRFSTPRRASPVRT